VFIDVSDIILLKRAKEDIQAQKVMFASVSHEFRTPLNAILNSYRFIQTSNDTVVKELKDETAMSASVMRMNMMQKTETMRKFISMGLNSSIMLLSLIEDILDLSKMDSGTFTVSKDFFEVENLVSQVKEVFQYQCKMKKLQLNIEIDPSLKGLQVYSDQGRIKQILMNLISNSFKFTFKGSISIKVKSIDNENGEFIKFTVEDTGIGIKKDDQSKLFKLFGMISHKKKSINPNGCGIGLTVSKKYVEKLGGEIDLKSEFGKGTSINFTIDLKRNSDSKEEIKQDSRNSRDSLVLEKRV